MGVQHTASHNDRRTLILGRPEAAELSGTNTAQVVSGSHIVAQEIVLINYQTVESNCNKMLN